MKTVHLFTLQPLKVLFSPKVSGWLGGQAGEWQGKGCAGCISETARYRVLILGKDFG